MPDSKKDRPNAILTSAALSFLWMMPLLSAGCTGQGSTGNLEQIKVWGRRGLGDGQFQKPRAIAYGPDENLYIVDMTARIQVFDTDGNFLRSWRTPEYKVGKPCGLSISNDNMLMVADTHYFRILFYSLDGQLDESRTIGGENGTGPGQFGFVTDIAQDSKGNYYVSEYGDYDRIQKFSPEGQFLCEWGGHGEKPGEFLRPQGLTIDKQDRLWVVDSSNHRIQVFDLAPEVPELGTTWGEMGRGPGQFYYPYDLFFDDQGFLYVCEFGNHRIQKFTTEGEFLGTWGTAGREVGQVHQPWAACLNKEDEVHILDSYNNRIQTFPKSAIAIPSDSEP